MASLQSDTSTPLPCIDEPYSDVGRVLGVAEVQQRLNSTQPTVFYAPQILEYYDKNGQLCTALQKQYSAINTPCFYSPSFFDLPDKHLTPSTFLPGTAHEIRKRQRNTQRARGVVGGATNAEAVGSDSVVDSVHVTPDALDVVNSHVLSCARPPTEVESTSSQRESAKQNNNLAASNKSTDPCTDVMQAQAGTRDSFQRAKSIFMGEEEVSITSYYHYYFIDKDGKQKRCDTHRIMQNGPDLETLVEFGRLSQAARTKASFRDQSEIMRVGLQSLDDKSVNGNRGRVLYVEPHVYKRLLRDQDVDGCIYKD
jgi:hypothetical protein